MNNRNVQKRNTHQVTKTMQNFNGVEWEKEIYKILYRISVSKQRTTKKKQQPK